MKSIWKFGLSVTDLQVVSMPLGSEILCVQTQNGQPQLWAMVDPKAEFVSHRQIAIFGTGHSIPDEPVALRKYIGTFQMHDGGLVFHAFDNGPLAIEHVSKTLIQ
jgi:hypothetical protein